MSDVILQLKSDFVAEVLDTANVNLYWTSRHLQDGRHSQALVAFHKLVIAVREAASEMAAVRTIVAGEKLTGEAAAEYRADREKSAKFRSPPIKPCEAA